MFGELRGQPPPTTTMQRNNRGNDDDDDDDDGELAAPYSGTNEAQRVCTPCV